ncbi:MAG: 16S rRNA (cytidine(1402)-2'-O)-methyltransferase [Patulibacter sp.]
MTLCPTPIGNLADCSPRVAAALLDADLVLCEDTRRTGKLLHHLAAQAGRDRRPPMRVLHDHNERGQVEALVGQLAAGLRAALCSDAGTPLVSDPGHALVRGCVQAGVAVDVLPGPSAVLVALAASGLPADRWRFVGFAPRNAQASVAVLLDEETTVAFEAPGRVAATLAALAGADPQREVVVARELTKLHEEVVRGRADELAARFAGAPPKGEVTLVVAGAERAVDEAAAIEAVERLVAAGARTKDAAAVVAGLTGARTNALYRAVQARRSL